MLGFLENHVAEARDRDAAAGGNAVGDDLSGLLNAADDTWLADVREQFGEAVEVGEGEVARRDGRVALVEARSAVGRLRPVVVAPGIGRDEAFRNGGELAAP